MTLCKTDSLRQFSAEQLNAREEKTGQTLLIVAAMAGNKKTMETLLNIKGVNPNVADDKGLTPLMHAVRIHNRDVVSALLASKDVDINIQDKSGMNALEHARHMGWTDIELSLSTNQPSKKLKPNPPNFNFSSSVQVS